MGISDFQLKQIYTFFHPHFDLFDAAQFWLVFLQQIRVVEVFIELLKISAKTRNSLLLIFVLLKLNFQSLTLYLE